jgi:hypothetical protein
VLAEEVQLGLGGTAAGAFTMLPSLAKVFPVERREVRGLLVAVVIARGVQRVAPKNECRTT